MVAVIQRALASRPDVKPRVLCVDGNAEVRQIVTVVCHDIAGIDFSERRAAARRKPADEAYSLVIPELQLPDGSGQELLLMLSATEVSADELRGAQAALVTDRYLTTSRPAR